VLAQLPLADFILLIGLGGLVVLITRDLLIRGITQAGMAWRIRPKVQGQVLGYATSAPELVGTAATAAQGLLGAGLWNIAASNIINVTLFMSAAIYFKRTGALVKREYIDELGFAAAAISFPLVLSQKAEWAGSPWTALVLFGFFCVYLIVDRLVNAHDEDDSEAEPADISMGWWGVGRIVLGVLGIMITGHYLGVVAESIVNEVGVPEWAVGWVLGVITSLPELTSFFAVFSAARGMPGDDACQRNLDNLAASNMSNVGLVYPIGIMVFLAATT